MIWIAVILTVFLLIAFPKKMLMIAGVAAVAILILFLLIASADERTKKERDAVTVSVRFDPTACSPDFPLHVTITNGGAKVISKVTWRFAAFRPGYSSDLAEYSDAARDAASDKILGRGESYSVCYRAPKTMDGSKVEQLEWKAEGKWVEFKD
jgi:hypothetical protein